MTFEEATTEQLEATDPDYLTWREAKIRKALAEADAHPEKLIPQHEIWKRFGMYEAEE